MKKSKFMNRQKGRDLALSLIWGLVFVLCYIQEFNSDSTGFIQLALSIIFGWAFVKKMGDLFALSMNKKSGDDEQ